jgi:hypothetical protein
LLVRIHHLSADDFEIRFQSLNRIFFFIYFTVSSHATWLHSLCEFSLRYEPEEKSREMFKKGEMRSVGIKFD